MYDFFKHQFNKDFYQTNALIEFIEKNFDELPIFVHKSISHIINFHYLMNKRFKSERPDSELWDLLPQPYLSRLHHQNYLETIEILENRIMITGQNHSNDLQKDEKDGFFLFLYEILSHTQYHRAQINYVIKQINMDPPSSVLIMIE
jgi:hypothetical protein